jgi:predicted  nucleic acid-binding Zn-ribbon protein
MANSKRCSLGCSASRALQTSAAVTSPVDANKRCRGPRSFSSSFPLEAQNNLRSRGKMSLEALQERLTALQETTSQLKELIDRLAALKFQPGSVPLSADEDDNVSSELGAEISQIIREESEDLELLQEEITDLRSGRPGSDTEHSKARLRDGVKGLQQELKR